MRIILSILVFTFLVLIHELGHFLMAKILGIKAYELSIGMGPKLFGKKVRDTEYSLRAIPFGAYVRFSDFEEADDEAAVSNDEENLDENDFKEKNSDKSGFFEESDSFMAHSPWKRIKVVAMGPIVNILFAMIIIIGVFYFNGFPTNKLDTVVENMPAYEQGLEKGDVIMQVGYTDTDSWEDIYNELSKITSVEEDIRLQVKKAEGQTEEIYLKAINEKGRFVIGITPAYEKNLFKSIQYGAQSTLKQSTMMIDMIKNLFIGRADIDNFSGPVGIVNVVGEATKMGPEVFFIFVAMLSLNLGILNLLPIPGLDGSKILIYGYEMISKKPMNRVLETRLTIAGFLLIIGFSIFITYKDIMRLITG